MKVSPAAARKLLRLASERIAVPAESLPPQTVRLPWPPSGNHRLMIIRGRMIKTAAARRFLELVRMLCAATGVRVVSGLLAVSIRAYRPRAVGDVDGPIKIVLDGLTGAAYVDDSQIRLLRVELHDDKTDPRVVVCIGPYRRGEGAMCA